MSRSLLLLVAVCLWIAFEATAIYFFLLDRRLTRELVRHTWSRPTTLLSPSGRQVGILYGVDWRITAPVRLASLPRYVSDAFVAAEDVRFRHHLGVDPIGIARALWLDLRAHGITQGGSTIDQQIIKARFLSNERTWRRKLIEIPLAVVLDARMAKDEILEIYLNDVYLGHSGGKPVLGIDEASRLYFDKRPQELRLDEAALLAGMIRAPNRDTPEKRPDIVRTRRNAILAVMHDRGWIDDGQYNDAITRVVEFNNGQIPQAQFPFYLRALRAELVDDVGVERIIEGGLNITCEIDPRAQAAAERAASNGPGQLESRFGWIRAQARSEPLQTAIFSVDPRSGGVRALVGGSDYRLSPFDRTTAMRRQPGSAFKPFAYLAAIASKKATPASLLLDAPLRVDVSGGQSWEPHNYDERFRGRVTLRQAFEESLNVPTVRLTEQVGLGRVVDTPRRTSASRRSSRASRRCRSA
ncbi:MAG TPA: transglycosylase domain-containing protein [Thermoanaerobaculia bacterium]|nr:transglycosylase domain-containing protein [Thermoanaerobaculia bacterium]